MKKTKEYYRKFAGYLCVAGLISCVAALFLVGFDITKLSSTTPYEKKVYEMDMTDIKEIVVDTSFDDITILPSKDEQIHVTCYENNVTSYEPTTRGEQLRIEQQNHRKFYHYFMSIDFNLFQNDNIVLEIPASYQDAVTIKTTNGDIDLSAFPKMTNLHLTTTFGDIRVEDVEAMEQLNANTTNGKIVFMNSDVQGDVEATTTFGKIEVNNIDCKGNVTLSSSNKDIVLDQVQVEKEMHVDTTFGDIEVAKSHAQKTYLSTTNGNVDIKNAFHTEEITISSTFGYIEFQELRADVIDLETSNQDIRGKIIGVQSEYTIDSKASNGNTTLLASQGTTDKRLLAYTSFGDCEITFEAERK